MPVYVDYLLSIVTADRAVRAIEAPYGGLWGPMGAYGDLWGLVGTYGDLWGPMEAYGGL